MEWGVWGIGDHVTESEGGSLTPAEVGGSESGQVREAPQSFALTLPLDTFLSQDPKARRHRQKEKDLGSGVLARGWLTRVCLRACALPLSARHTTINTSLCTCAHMCELAFRDGSEVRESEGSGRGQGTLSLWLMTQSLWNNPSACCRGQACLLLPSHQPLLLLRLEWSWEWERRRWGMCGDDNDQVWEVTKAIQFE